MTKQYVGARYVPKFYEGTNGSAWDENVPYEALTIVTYLNNSYTSKVPVPANIGNPADNPTYWALTGNYSAQVEQYREDVESYKSEVDELKNVVYRKFIFVSDSYGASVVPSIVSQLGLSSYDYVNIQQGGSCFGAPTGTSLNWQYMIENTVTTDDDSYTDVVYIGGANELSYTEANITANAVLCYDYVKTRFKNAKQWYMFAGYCAGLNGTAHPLVDRLRLKTRLPQAIVKTERPFIINEVWYPLANTDNISDSDWIHPTTSGAKLIASLICSCLYGGSADYQSDYEEITLTSSVHTIQTQQIYMQRHNSKVNVAIRSLLISLGSGVTLGSQGVDITLGVLSSKLLRGGTMVPGGNEYRTFLGTTHCSADNGINWVVELFLSNANELIARFIPTYPITDPFPTTISGLQIVYFNALIDDYLN